MKEFFKSFFATIFGILAGIVVLSIAVGGAISIFAMGHTDMEIKRGSLLEINMNEVVVDSYISSPIDMLRATLMGDAPTTTTLSVITALEYAAQDNKITALSLRLDGIEAISMVNISEIREAVKEFRKVSKKPVYAYAESYSQAEYYLASVADSIYLHPLGGIEWQGVALNTMLYGDLLSEVGIKAEVFRPEECSYKSAVEPYTSNAMSPQSREQSQSLVDGFWSTILNKVGDARGIDTASLRRIAREKIYIESKDALDERMVDRIAYRDQYDAALEQVGVVERDKGGLRAVTMAKYAWIVDQLLDTQNTGDDKSTEIGLIYADGIIVDGDIQSSSNDNVVSGIVMRQLRRARLDDDIRAVVVRVNSPGGSALAADAIWREMKLLQEVKPLIVSMGSYAASGGYYISAPADLILVDPLTITGSIGVYGVMFAYEEALHNHLKISIDGVVSSPSADFGRSPREITPIERSAMMRSVNTVYDTFRNCVAQGRHLSPAVVNALSGGRVWSGEEAVQCGLADGVGGIKQALLIAADRSGCAESKIEIVDLAEETDQFGNIMNRLSAKTNLNILSLLKSTIEEREGVMTLSHETIQF